MSGIRQSCRKVTNEWKKTDNNFHFFAMEATFFIFYTNMLPQSSKFFCVPTKRMIYPRQNPGFARIDTISCEPTCDEFVVK